MNYNYLNHKYLNLDLHNELFLFEEWLSQTEEQLWTFQIIRNSDISLEDFQSKLIQHTVRLILRIGQC